MKKIIIIGAGIVGAATAYELVRKGMDVVLIDQHIKGRATSASAGIICPWITQRRNKAWYELAKNGAAFYEQLIETLQLDGEDNTGYKKVGAIRLHTEIEKLKKLETIAKQRRELAPQIGKIALLNKEETKIKFPFLDPIYYSLFIEGAARVDGGALRDSLIRASLKRGATYIEGNARLVHSANEVTGVHVDGENMDADITIATNGVWMPALLSPLGLALQIQAQKGELIHLQTDKSDTSSLPVVMPLNNQYVLSFDDGRIVVGASHQKVEQLNTDISAGSIHYILDQALQVAPSLENCKIVESRVGFRPFTLNHLPVFGPVPTIKRLLIANGLGASGLTTGPFIGTQLAKIVNEEQLDLPLEDYSVEQALK